MKRRLVNVSPWVLAAACAMLAVIIGTFAVNNYRREKQLMTEALVQKGMAIIGFFDTGVRLSMRANLGGGGSEPTAWHLHVQNVIDQIQGREDIHFVELINADGKILAATSPERVGKTVSQDVFRFLGQAGQKEPVFRLDQSAGQAERGFQVARRYQPRPGMPMVQRNSRTRPMMGHMFRGRNQPENLEMRKLLDELRDQEFTLLVELDMAEFDAAVKRQVFQIGILSIVLLLVGLGGWLSLLTLQGFRGSQNRLRSIQAFNDLLVQSLPVGLIATDDSGCIKSVNSAAEQIAGVAAREMVTRLPADVLPAKLASSLLQSGSEYRRQQSDEYEFISEQGRAYTLLSTTLPVYDDAGIFSGSVLLMQDITELRHLESELMRSERLAALGKMAAGVAHELRNPLSSIKGLAVLLKKKVEDAKGQETADILVREVERLNRSISELLDYARPAQLQKKAVPLEDILSKAVNLIGVDAVSQSITVVLDEERYKGAFAYVDEDKMIQVFLNLLLNGVQAMPDGGTLSVTTRYSERTVAATIEDSGEGITETHLEKIFDPYFTTKSQGTGLGLALSSKIVEEHAGKITVQSDVGKGTCVTVELPLYDMEDGNGVA